MNDDDKLALAVFVASFAKIALDKGLELAEQCIAAGITDPADLDWDALMPRSQLSLEREADEKYNL